MFLNIQIDLIILKTFDQLFTLTTKKSLHIIFKVSRSRISRAMVSRVKLTVSRVKSGGASE